MPNLEESILVPLLKRYLKERPRNNFCKKLEASTKDQLLAKLKKEERETQQIQATFLISINVQQYDE
jgi:hypothetical protein